MLPWLTEKLWVKGLISDRLSLSHPERILFSEHHLSHAASAYYCSPYTEAAVLTADGVGEWSTTTLGVGKDNKLKILYELKFPHSIGLLYSAFTSFLGFQVNDSEYKVMGMGAYGKPRYIDKIYKLIRLGPHGSFSLNMEYFSYHRSTGLMFSRRFEELFGSPRPKDQAESLNPYYADVASSLQKVTEDLLVEIAKYLKQITGMRSLCMAGGVALNGLANYRILKEAGFDEIYIQPAASDAGGALGAALWANHMVLNQPRSYTMAHAYYGENHCASEIANYLKRNSIPYEEIDDPERLINKVVDSLSDNKVIGWSQGKAEWGPRALGNRSILASPCLGDMKDLINNKIKFREAFRPFAPAVLEEKAGDFFDIPQDICHYPARFMLYIAPVRDNKRDLIPAVTHVDGTARLQSIPRATNELFHQLVSTWGEASGVPVLLNTSFNLRGEPIVNTPDEAVSTFSRSGLDLLVMDRFIVTDK